MVTKRFRHNGCKISIKDYKDSWDKKIVVKKGKKKSDVIYNLKHMSDAESEAKKICKRMKK